jgi:hydroxymethylbilane synthase
LELLSPLHHKPTHIELTVERAFLARLDGSCRTPIAGLARYDAQTDTVSFEGEVLSPDGCKHVGVTRSGASGDAFALGDTAAREILDNKNGAFWHGQ